MSESDAAGRAEIDRLMRTVPPMDATVAAALLREAKEVFDELGVVFFLRQGTCLGAVRDGAFIPWDDDIDLGSIYGMHGMNKRSVASVAEAFRARGFHVEAATYGGETWLGIMKRHIRIDWYCYRVRRGHVFHFPNVSIPVELFSSLQEIDFAGERFLVPSPPEEYLRCKYGPNWATPTRIGYERDVVENLPAERMAWIRRFRRFLAVPSRWQDGCASSPRGEWQANSGRRSRRCGFGQEPDERQRLCAVLRASGGHIRIGRAGGGEGRGSVRGAACAPVGGTCTGPTPSGRRGVSSCSQRSADELGLDPPPLR